MGKNSEMYINDSKGFEDNAKKSFEKILKIFATTDGWSQEKLAGILNISSTTLRKYRREGTVSLYTSKRLSEFLELNQNYFNGKLPITETEEQHIRKRLEKLYNDEKKTLIDDNDNSINESDNLVSILKNNIAKTDSYDKYSLDELKELKGLFENNLLMVSGKIQIVQVVINNKKGEE